jgi:Zn-finger nucleic acid-binding protein
MLEQEVIRPNNAEGKPRKVKNRFNFMKHAKEEQVKETVYWLDEKSVIKNPFRLAKFYVCGIDGCQEALADPRKCGNCNIFLCADHATAEIEKCPHCKASPFEFGEIEIEERTFLSDHHFQYEIEEQSEGRVDITVDSQYKLYKSKKSMM